ncbi:MAG: 2-oxo acid dehydrogenase subunit E2 [Bdellovibrio sp.]|nr:2-oxo acid dehydrogenase subunit E2 [Bdellovibrio sp.]
MKYNFTMPSLGADMNEGKLMKWKIKVGDQVKRGQVVAQIETTKSVVDIESFRTGTVLELLAKEGDVVAVNHPLAIFEIDESQEILTAGLKVDRPLVESEKIPASFTGINLREAISKAMTKSKQEIPHYYLKRRVLLDNFMNWLDEKNSLLPVENRLLIPAVLHRAICLALEKHPEMNGHYRDGKFVPSSDVNVGTAIALKDGAVMVPAVLQAQKMTLAEFNHAYQDLVVRTREGGLKNSELTDGTLTVTNIGDLGSDEVYGIIFPPQVAMVGLGRIRKEAIIVDGQMRAGFVIDLTLSADHRVSDGLLGAKFLNEIDRKLNNPSTL